MHVFLITITEISPTVVSYRSLLQHDILFIKKFALKTKDRTILLSHLIGLYDMLAKITLFVYKGIKKTYFFILIRLYLSDRANHHDEYMAFIFSTWFNWN